MRAIYLDYAATSPLRPEVRAAMEPCLSDTFGNASSIHSRGRSARAALDRAREQLARALGAAPGEILFVGGGTEANNLAVLGRADLRRGAGQRPFVALSAIEHSSVRGAAEAVEAAGGERLVVPVSPFGIPDAGALEEVWTRKADVLSLIWVNNEVGLVSPVEDVARAGQEQGVPVHADAVQAIGKVPVRLDRVPVALASGSAHKIGGPKGVGFLFVRHGTELAPRVFGGGQERGLRPGTENVAGAVGLAEAVRLAVAEQGDEAKRLEALRVRMELRLLEAVPDARVHGTNGSRAPHLLHLGIPGVDGEALLMSLDLEGVEVSSGSACASGSTEASPVLRALYGRDGTEGAPLRFSLGGGTDERAIDEAVERTVRVIERLSRTASARH
ncbi:MAG: cysteine desulfurase family protein [Gemmatimonadota bacterium]